jgi:hypothetical protein
VNVELFIQNGDTVYFPPIKDGITLTLERQGVPGKLSFTAVLDNTLNFVEGNQVSLTVDGNKMFYGFVFSKKRTKDNLVQVTAYDQLRYLKNKDTYVYTNKTLSDVIRMIASDFILNIGDLAETKYIIPNRVQDNVTLADIIQDALMETLAQEKVLYVFYDDYGKLTLKPTQDMYVNLLIDADTGENYDYTSSIDTQTYNQITLAYDNEESGKRDIYVARSTENINTWGVLQYYEKIDNPLLGQMKADALLDLYNTKTRNLVVSGVFGDTRVKAGCLVSVQLNLGDITVNNWMLVERVTHTFNEGQHNMNLTLRGGEFIA